MFARNLLVTVAALATVVVLTATAKAITVDLEQRRIIADIVRDISTPATRSEAIGKLIAIVGDQDQDPTLRWMAADKLGDLQASEAKDMLRDLALKLELKEPDVYLKRSTTRAYWKIVVAEQPSPDVQEELLMSLLSKFAPQPQADIVWHWAVDELANRGVERALPRMEKCIERRIGADEKRANYEIWLCKTKVDLLTKNPDRQVALSKGLATRDPNQNQKLIRWAIDELGKLDTRKSRRTLVKFALRLQRRYYTRFGKRVEIDEKDLFGRRADSFYHQVIEILRASGMTDEQIKETGLRPDKYFLRS